MNLIIRLLITAGVSYGLTYFMSGVAFNDGFKTAIIFAVVLGLVNTFIKPILKIISMPLTVISLGLFALVINTVTILIADYFIDNMKIDGFVRAFIFSVLLSIFTSILNGIFVDD